MESAPAGGGLFRTDGGLKVSSGLDIDAEVQEAWSKVRSGEATWLLMGYEGKSRLKTLASGTGCAGLLSNIADDQVVFGGLQTKAGKFLCLMCTGADVGGMAKGRAAAHKNAAFNALEGTIGEVCALSKDEFSEQLEKIDF
ncbi:unnamed protein product [Symbiodinium natans]|uniref:ADF-H domain-containing protein n=1 Tax=Symbiodinium natans TaxID=878477 RepID=A0A812Q1F5_9DINO|nr:unnamed protein product [Symbiodinium natans]